GMAALAVADGDGVTVTSIREGSLVESVVALLPAVPAGPGLEVAVPVAVVRRFLAAEDDPEVPPAAVATLGALAEARVRGGQFGVNMADPRSGELFRGIPVVSWFDTTEGRYLMTTDGDTLTVAPADAAVIAVRLHEVLASG
ncbi:MAG TPA: ESX secretion-associated protein EspG, partial [Pseudonocardiaceae bacterium]|nr:ESX secretion-associated protein EspG [Pseudonocardiaceae bacterium]